MNLRPYQEELVEKLRASLRVHRRSCLQSPTGSGKSVLIAHMIGRTAAGGHSAWLVCHRSELLEQLSGTLWAAGVSHGVIASGRVETRDAVQVASVQTLVRRLGRLPPPTLLALDEAHHSTAGTWRKVIDHCKGSLVVGLTATPCRTSGEGLDDIFNDLVPGPSIEWLTEQGYLAPYVLYRPPGGEVDTSDVHTRGGDWATSELEALVDQTTIVGNAVEHYLRMVAPGNCLTYCVSRKHARDVAAAYCAAGVNARYCGGDTPEMERNAIVSGLRRGEPAVVTSVDLFGEGLDVPGLKAVQLLRPTQSLTLFLQQVGRCLRPEPGKDHAIILDHVNNVGRHDLPCAAREWTLVGRKKRRGAQEKGPALRHCPECFAVFRAVLGACPLCGWVPETRERIPEVVDGQLREVDKAAIARERAWKRQEEGIVRTTQGFEGLVALAIERGYRFGWAARRWSDVNGEPIKNCFTQESRIRKELKTSEAAPA